MTEFIRILLINSRQTNPMVFNVAFESSEALNARLSRWGLHQDDIHVLYLPHRELVLYKKLSFLFS